MKRIFFIFLIIALLTSLASVSAVEKKDVVCSVYFTGIGCPHCAKADPFVFGSLLQENPNLVIIEYEIYQDQVNAPLHYQYATNYNIRTGIPSLIFNSDTYLRGDTPILNNADFTVKDLESNPCPLTDALVDFKDVDFNMLSGNPKIWVKNRIIIKGNERIDSEIIKDLLFNNITRSLENIDYEVIEPVDVALSGDKRSFAYAYKIEDWIFQSNAKVTVNINQEIVIDESVNVNVPWCVHDGQNQTQGACEEEIKELTFAKIMSLAAIDAVNPCALAVLVLMLVAILTYNPKDKKKVIYAGLAFALSVFVMYLVYGLVIIRFFQLVQALTSIRLVLYRVLGGAAIILGILNLKDFFYYKPGSFMTEMPMFMRPKAKKMIGHVTSPKGAFFVGAFVTIFLLPCTIGPYVIASGILSALQLIQTLPWLLIYNLIFILPMIGITLFIYAGFTTVENVAGWKDKNIKYLHLISGIIIFLLGLAMILGWV